MNEYYINFKMYINISGQIVKKFSLISMSKLIMRYKLRTNLVFIILLIIRF